MAKKVAVKELLEAGVHFGHLTRRWNPNMAPYIYMERNGIHIINLYKSAAKLQEAGNALSKIAASGRKILFVATKKQAKEIVSKEAMKANMPYITERWPGGMLTNFVTIRKAVKKMDAVDRMKKDGSFDTLSKKERLQVNRMRAKLEKQLGSISEMTRLPGALFVVDTTREHIAVKEAQKLNIPIFAMVDTNSDPREVEFPIPANDDASRSIDMVVSYVSDAVVEGLTERKSEKENQKAEKAKKEETKKAAGTEDKPKPVPSANGEKQEKSETKAAAPSKKEEKAPATAEEDPKEKAAKATGVTDKPTAVTTEKLEKEVEKVEKAEKGTKKETGAKQATKAKKPETPGKEKAAKPKSKTAAKAKATPEVPSKKDTDEKAMKEAKEKVVPESKKETLKKTKPSQKTEKKEG